MRLNRFKVLELMEAAGWRTQAELAEHLGVTSQAFSQWMRKSNLSVESLGALCEALNCTPNDILITAPSPKAAAPTVAVAA